MVTEERPRTRKNEGAKLYSKKERRMWSLVLQVWVSSGSSWKGSKVVSPCRHGGEHPRRKADGEGIQGEVASKVG